MKKILILLCLCSCSMSEIIDMPITKAIDTTEYVGRVKKDTIECSDVPITFDVTVEDWE